MVDLSSNTLCYILEMVGCGYSGDIEYLDRLQADYGICLEDAMSNHDFGHVLKSYIDGRSETMPLNYLIHKVLMEFALQACEKYGADYGKFDIYVNATDSHIYYNGEEFHDAEEFEELMSRSYDYYTYELDVDDYDKVRESANDYSTIEEAEEAAMNDDFFGEDEQVRVIIYGHSNATTDVYPVKEI